MKKLIFALAIIMLAVRAPAPIVGETSPTLTIIYYSTNNTVTVAGTGAQPKRILTLEISTDLTTTNWTDLSPTAKVANDGTFGWTNFPATNPLAFYQTHY